MIRVLALSVIMAALALSSCIAVGGTQNDQHPTAGKQLIDLKAALDAGAITQTEFDAKKAQILALR